LTPKIANETPFLPTPQAPLVATRRCVGPTTSRRRPALAGHRDALAPVRPHRRRPSPRGVPPSSSPRVAAPSRLALAPTPSSRRRRAPVPNRRESRDVIGRNWTFGALHLSMLKRTAGRNQCSCMHLIGSYVSDTVFQSFRSLTTSNAKQSASQFQRQPLHFELSFDNAAYNDLLRSATRKKSL
ncbi:hypothetical protein Taro_028013, partial [Colocasia esculenta]|nr:hypothetical protein [Colocasia esculenta]